VKRQREQPHVTIYTDGSHSTEDGIGGWAAILRYEREGRAPYIKEISGGARGTTNIRMEMLAVINGLDALKYPCSVSLYCDYLPLITAMQLGTVRKWRERDWTKSNKYKGAYKRTAAQKRVNNVDLWTQILRLDDKHLIEWNWVEGHSGNPPNMRADRLARQAAYKLRGEMQLKSLDNR
jgi:ribonuclease HI